MDHLVVLLVCVAPPVCCFSSGKVTASCEDLRPHHAGMRPQPEPAPFTVTADVRSYQAGQEVTVHLQAADSKTFTGFLLQARELGGQSPVGSFSLTTGGAQLLTCSNQVSSAVSHISESPKSSIQVKWRLETPGDSIQFHATFVENYATFWVDVRSSPLVSNDSLETFSSRPSSPTPAPGPVNTTTSTTTTTIHQASPPALQVSAVGCGVTKVCFSRPPHCDPATSADCYFMSAAPVSPSAFRYEMSGPSDGYVSFGFSDDQIMGNDDIYICRVSAKGPVELQHAFSTGRKPPEDLPLGNVSELRAWVRDQVVSCSFTSYNPIVTQRSTGASRTSAYHLMFAHGSSGSSGIQFHRGTFVSSSKIDISQPQQVRAAQRPDIIKAHGALMLVAWMTTGSLGMLVARYLKALAKGHELMGKDVWFVVHVAAMSVSVTATAVAFILSFSHVRSWSGGAHPVLGCLVMILCVVQPVAALLRCGPDHPLRFVFSWSHALNALAIKALAVAAVFTGLALMDSAQDGWLQKVMGGLVGWEAFFYILLEVHLKVQTARKDSPQQTKMAADVLLVALFLLGNLAFLVALLVGIGMS